MTEVPQRIDVASATKAVYREPREYRFFLVAGEDSGDALGAKLMAELNQRLKGRVRYLGVGGERMRAEGLLSQFPISEVAVMGPLSILPRLPRIVRRVYQTVAAGLAAEPDAVVIIDSPEFTHPIAKRIRKKRPAIPVIDYVCPSVWAWRPGRAKKMRRYVDHVLALLPFEPEALLRLNGPPATYVGHPLIERFSDLAALDPKPLQDRLQLDPARPVLVVLPGSRRSEVDQLLGVFLAAVGLLPRQGLTPEVLIPVVPHLKDMIATRLKWSGVEAHLIETDEDKWRALKVARAALAASGTVTLELALAGTPSVIGYRVDALIAPIARRLIKAPTVVLANLVLGDSVYPEYLQEDCTPAQLASALGQLLAETPQRARQITLLAETANRLALTSGTPSGIAADVVMRFAESGGMFR